MATKLSAGVARVDITPPPGIAHAGWGAQTHQRAAGVDLPLWATALALSDGDQTVVIVDIDLLYIWDDEAPAALKGVADLTGLPLSHIRLAYTHTHSGPINGRSWSMWMKEGTDMVPAYDRSVANQVAGVAWQALNNLRPVRAAAGAGHCEIAVNRRFQRPEDGAVVCGRNWEAAVDHQVQVVRFDELSGKPLAAIVNYACHPITVGPDCDLITPDYPGVVKRVVESATGATCLFLQGAAGNVGPVRGVARGGLGEYKRLGSILGHEASRVWWEMEVPRRGERYIETLESGSPLAVYADEPLAEVDLPLRVGTRTARMPLKTMPPPEGYDAAFAEHSARLNSLRESNGSPEEIKRETMLAKRSATRAALARKVQGQTHRDFHLQAFTLGDQIALMAVPGEPFVEIGLQVKAASPFKHTLFSGYSNTDWAYIPMPDAYPLGGYEIEVTPFAPEAAAVLVEESGALLREIAAGRS